MFNQHHSDPQRAVPGYRVGDVVNGHVFTGTAWVPVAQSTAAAGPAVPATPADMPRPGPREAQPLYRPAPVKAGMSAGVTILVVIGGAFGVLVLLGLVASIAIPVFLNQSGRAAQSTVESDLREAAGAAETHWSMTGTPPVDAQVLDDYGWSPAAGVTITLVSSSPAGYCLEGAHVDLPGSTWHYDFTGGLGEGRCP